MVEFLHPADIERDVARPPAAAEQEARELTEPLAAGSRKSNSKSDGITTSRRVAEETASRAPQDARAGATPRRWHEQSAVGAEIGQYVRARGGGDSDWTPMELDDAAAEAGAAQRKWLRAQALADQAVL